MIPATHERSSSSDAYRRSRAIDDLAAHYAQPRRGHSLSGPREGERFLFLVFPAAIGLLVALTWVACALIRWN